MKFTKETEVNNTIAFLDVQVKRIGTKFETSVYRKKTFTGLGTSFFSFIPSVIKKSIVKSAIFRAFNISSSYKLFDLEIRYLTSFFCRNGYPRQLIESSVSKFLQRRFNVGDIYASAKKLDKYFVLPFFGDQSAMMQKDVMSLLSKFYPYLNAKIVLRNPFSVGKLFRYKDRLPLPVHSGVVYKYCCASCQASYVGSTYQRLFTRVAQHQGKSHRTGQMMSCPPSSSVRDHALSCSASLSIEDFEIVDRNSSFPNLRILESLYIHRLRPQINDTSSAYPLNLTT